MLNEEKVNECLEEAKKSKFVHLHCHSPYSLLDGMAEVKEMAKKAKELGMPAIAITDHGAMYGVVAFFDACKAEGVKPIIGCEFYEAPESRFDKEKKDGDAMPYYHLVLLAKDEVGYKNLCILTTRANTEGFYYKPRIDFELLKDHHEGLVCLSACLAGELPRAIVKAAKEGTPEAKAEVMAIVEKYHELFGEDYYLEVQNHGIPEEMIVAEEIRRISAETGIKAVCTNDVHYLDSADAEAHDWLLAMQTKKTIDDPDRMRYDGDYSFLPEEEMRKRFPNWPEVFTNTLEIVDKCNFEFHYAHGPADYRMPKVEIPESYNGDFFAYLKDEAYAGLDKRYPEGHPEREQALINLEFELGIIKNMGFAEYFLDTRKTILWARAHGILVGPGRGSGAGSTLNYCLTITDLDPIKYGLLFERFLNPERVSMPDIDVDYQYDRKDDVIASEAESNGKKNFCKIQTLGGLKSKQVLKDTARVAGLSVAEGNLLSGLIPGGDPKMTLTKAMKQNPEIESTLNSNPRYRKVWDIALKLEGLKKSAGTHACGHIPTPRPCEELFPCGLDQTSGYLVCQYDMAEAEHLGNLKKDLLMLRNLTIISEASKAVKERYGVDVPLWTEEVLNDMPALKLFWAGDTDGVFQFESEGMRKFMAELRPTCFEDIIAGVSLYRPGPMDYIPDYIKGKHDPESITYDVPELEEILAPTYGVITYQEQVMQIVQRLAGFSKGEADVVRKGMGKKKMDVIEAEGKKFINGDERFPGCVKNGYDRATVEALWAKMAKFGEYAFNKSHAACYAAIAMQTAYLKAHYPTELYAGLLTSVMDKTEQLSKYIASCKAHGIEITKPDVNTSGLVFTAVGSNQISFGLASIKGMGTAVAEQIVRSRNENGPYKGLTELLTRCTTDEVKANKKVLESLIKAGALDCLGHTRAAMLEAAPKIAKKLTNLKKKAKEEDGQMSLFEFFGIKNAEKEDEDGIEQMPELKLSTLLEYEKESTGRYISGHPFDLYDGHVQVKGYKLTPLAEFSLANNKSDDDDDSDEADDSGKPGSSAPAPFREKQKCAIAGIIKDPKTFYTKKSNEPMRVFTLEDANGSVKVVVFPEAYAALTANGVSMDAGKAVAVKGSIMVDRQDGTYSVQANDMSNLDTVRRYAQAHVTAQELATGWPADIVEQGKDIIRFYYDGMSVDRPTVLDAEKLKILSDMGIDLKVYYLVS